MEVKKHVVGEDTGGEEYLAFTLGREEYGIDILKVQEIRGYEMMIGLGATMLARLPGPSKRLASSNQLVMLEDPTGAGAEAFRVLRTNLEFVTVDQKARSILITSALDGPYGRRARSRAGIHDSKHEQWRRSVRGR